MLVPGAPAVERADHGEGGEVDALGTQAGAADGADDVGDHVAPGRDEQQALLARLGALDDLERLEVDDRLVDRHRKLVVRVEAHGGLELLRIAQVRQLERPDDDLLVGDADADPLGEALVLAEERAERLRERVGVDDLAVANDARLERRERRGPTVMRPLTETAAAVMPLGSMSTPMKFFVRFAMGLASAIDSARRS